MSEDKVRQPQSPYLALAKSRVSREWMAAFCKATGISLRLLPVDVASNEMVGRVARSPFWTLLCQTAEGRNLYIKTRLELQRRALQESRHRRAQCLAGFTHAVIPIAIGGKQVATLLAGDVFLRRPNQADFDRVSRNLARMGLKADLPRLHKAWFNMPVVPPDQFEANVRMAVSFVKLLSDCLPAWMLANQDGEPQQVMRAKEFIQAHACNLQAQERGSLRLADVAHHVHCSPQHFCKMFRTATGMTFKNFLSLVRIEKAKSQLRDFSSQIKKVAYAAGFQTIAHFNHCFRKHTGLSPTQYRVKIRQANAKFGQS
ncbi:MAG: helix-turn-helix domain-containing protein [Verrucomicrobia bacterium]|nr:helix-turn-helix domain-containing protein [Verrucomicrobiota bacterium]